MTQTDLRESSRGVTVRWEQQQFTMCVSNVSGNHRFAAIWLANSWVFDKLSDALQHAYTQQSARAVAEALVEQ